MGVHVRPRACGRVCMCARAYLHVCARVRVRVCAHVCVRVRLCVCMSACVPAACQEEGEDGEGTWSVEVAALA